MVSEEPRAVLARLAEERGDDLASLSRLIGRNPAYVQQFIKRGTPRKLAEEDRRILAAYFDVPESLLGGRDPMRVAPAGQAASRRTAGLVQIPRLDVRASAGHGAHAEENSYPETTFDQGWIRTIAGGSSPAGLSTIRVSGDSMEPTLADGDEILVDRNDAADRLRDGIYVLRLDDGLLVKRLAINPASGLITIRSDNPRYPAFSDYDPASIAIIGRVVWFGRRIL